MPRIRSIKPDFFLDEELALVSYQTRLAFIGLWCQADREGRLEDRPQYLKALIFPYDEIDMESTLERLSNHIKTVGEPFITRYLSKGRKYIQVNNFLKHQRPHHTEQDSKFPAQAPIATGSKTVTPRIKKVGKEAVIKEEEFLRKSLFERFWEAWPKKEDKAKCVQWWERHKPSPELVDLMIGKIEALGKTPQWENQQYIPGPYKWLYGRRWEDEITGGAPQEATYREIEQLLFDKRIQSTKEYTITDRKFPDGEPVWTLN